MSECEHHSKRAVQQKVERMVRDVRVLQQSVQYSIAAKYGLPRIGTYQIADPQRNDCELIKQVLAGSRMKRQIVGKRVSQQQRKQHYPQRDSHRAQQRLSVDVYSKKLAIVVQIPVMNNGLRWGNRPEAVTEKKNVRN